MKTKSSVPFAFIMAVVGNAMMANARGRVGKVVFRKNLGQTVASELPVSVANPRTGFALMVAFYRSIAGFLRVGFKMTTNPRSAYNGFMKTNLPEAVDYTVPLSPVISWDDLRVAKGTMTATPITSVDADRSAGTVITNWDTSLTDVSQAATDEAYILVVNTTLNEIIAASATGTARSVGTRTLSLRSDDVSTNSITVYLFFVKANGAAVSDSSLLNATIVA